MELPADAAPHPCVAAENLRYAKATPRERRRTMLASLRGLMQPHNPPISTRTGSIRMGRLCVPTTEGGASGFQKFWLPCRMPVCRTRPSRDLPGRTYAYRGLDSPMASYWGLLLTHRNLQRNRLLATPPRTLSFPGHMRARGRRHRQMRGKRDRRQDLTNERTR